MLFLGKTFAGALEDDMESLTTMFEITSRPNGAASNGGSSGTTAATTGGSGKNNNAVQPLVGWCEVATHPGLVCAMTQSSNNPIIMMVKPDVIQVQEVKVVPAKTKVSRCADYPNSMIYSCRLALNLGIQR